MNVTCPKSGVKFVVPEFNLPHVYSSHEHPIFSLTTTQLVGLFEHIADPQCGTIDHYLLGLAVLSKLPNVWNVAVSRESAEPIVLGNLDKLVRVVIRIQSARLTESMIPAIVINKDTRDLENLPNWIQAYEDAFNDATNNSAAFRKDKQVARLEVTLDSLLKKSFDKNKTRISKVVSTWAAVTGDFPTSVKALWGEMIEFSFQENFMEVVSGKATLADYDELVEHCEDYIPHGSTLAAILMRKLRDAREMVREFEAPSAASKLRKLAAADLDSISGPGVNQHAASSNGDSVVFKAVSLNGEGCPKREDYPDQLSFLRDRVRWMKSQQAVTELNSVNSQEQNELDSI